MVLPTACQLDRATSLVGRAVHRVLHSDSALAVLDSHPDTYGCDYGQGGCRVAAVAIASLLPGSRVCAIRQAGNPEPQHFVVSWLGSYFDLDGASTEDQLLGQAASDWLAERSQLTVTAAGPAAIEAAVAPDPHDAAGVRLSARLAELLRSELSGIATRCQLL